MEYKQPMPDFLREAAHTPALLRLRNVGMHCGCQYTDFPLFRGLAPYSRYSHCLGVARILWDFTQDPMQTLAGLVHDAATPAFSHVVDFLNGDHLTQESTEEGLEQIIKNDVALEATLKKYHIRPEDICNHSRYPLADSPSPRLCADRLEYTLSNGVHYGFARDVQAMYDDLTLTADRQEFAFATPAIALAFARMALQCGKVYVCDQDRYAMERLSRLLKQALEEKLLTREELYTDENTVIEKLKASSLAAGWQDFCRLSRVFKTDGPGEFSYRIPAKKRYIDPLILGCGRVSQVFPEFRQEVEDFLSQSQDYYLCAE